MSDATLGMRLRYEIWREFAPYIGIERSNKYGGSADFARARGQRTSGIAGGGRPAFLVLNPIFKQLSPMEKTV